MSGAVLGGDWPHLAFPLEYDEKFGSCWAHWNGGLPWAETGIYEYLIQRIAENGSFDGCSSIEESNSQDLWIGVSRDLLLTS